ncbi:hypothetical protein, partial [Salmonella enterica]|uniref:hypothetical protein n=1 Tax=Salmonella enterica TaxID=28901 RepID=UPI003D2AD566
IHTIFCQDGYVCAPNDKCAPGPDLQRKIDICKEAKGPASLAACNELVRREPSKAGFYVDRGRHYGMNNQNDLALADFDRAVELDPDMAVAWHN